jgi:hypothetical protein
MRIFSLYYLPILIHYLLISTIANSQVQKIYLHPKAPGSGKQSQFVDSIRFIPLEIENGIEIGAYNYATVTEKYFMITDYPSKTILLYAKNGVFIKKVSYKKLGETFSPVYDKRNNRIVFFGNNKNYTLTQKDRISITLDWDNPRNKKYFKKYVIDLNDTSFSIVKDIPDQNDIVHAYHYYDDFYCQGQILTSTQFHDSVDYELKLYKNNQLVKSFFPYNHINEPRFLFSEEVVSLSLTDTPYTAYLTRPYCDTVYKMVKDSLFPLYQLVLPLENSLPASFFTTPFKNKTERDNFKRNNGWMLRQVYNFYETPRFIYFMVGFLSNYESYIFQKQTNVTYKTKNIKPDSSQYNLKLFGDYSVVREGDRFYKTLKASDLLTFFEQNKNVPPPKELENFLKNKPDGTTPVLVEFKLKN